MTPEGEHRLARALVAAQMGLLAAHLLPRTRVRRPVPVAVSRATTAAGLVVASVAAAQLRTGSTPSPLPNEHAQLQETGVFGVIRHPIYSALLLVVGGRAAASGDSRQAVVVMALLALLCIKSSFEERALTARFPAYAESQQRVPRFVPALPSHRSC